LEGIQEDTVEPPIPPGKDIHAHSQTSIGIFSEDLSDVTITEEDGNALHSWNYSSASAFNKEVIGVFKDMYAPVGSGTRSSNLTSQGGVNGAAGRAPVKGKSSCTVS